MRVVTLVAGALAATAVATAGNPPDPRQAQVVATGPGPCGIAARAGSIWVGVYGSGDLLAIDDTSGRIETRVRVGRWACRVAVGPAALWVTRDLAGELVRVSHGSGHIRRVPVDVAFDVLLARGSAWTTSAGKGTIAQLDAASARLVRVYRDGAFPAGLTWCGGRIWVGHAADLTWLTAIQPATHRLTRVEVRTRSPNWPRCVGGELWVTVGDSMLRVDPTSGAVLARIHVGGTPVEAASGPDGLVWVTDKERSLVFRIDPATNAITDSFRAGRGAYTMARAGDSMWITSFAGSDVRRFDR